MSGNEPGVADVLGDGDGERPIPDGHEFALLLTHDVDRPYKTYQSLFYALTQPEKRRYHLSSLLPGVNPYWQFENAMAVERDLGVRSAFYFLDEQPLRERPVRDWLSMDGWRLYGGRYSLSDPRIRDLIAALDDGGWEVGLHGSYESYRDRDRLRDEQATVEAALGSEVTGGRQHYLNLAPETWRHQRALGLRYDASLGSSDDYGFDHGYGVRRPFDDDFAVFPLTAMEQALPDPGRDYDAAWAACEDLLEEARDNDAVATVLWHPRHFSHRDFPGYLRLYRALVERALDLGAWVGPPGEFYETAELGE
ncbi:polysaccharide deacetylase family protein [Halobacterium litoreum]|uniref:Polysaccharide deacetylase family protein n=1 Tax=Halobacterium litoreum TaxID=2039234 RepID=A0ABD5NB69_9EURY|nr:polysaccharide deacetylase family protein [Halobacterium litoreum]UHH14660.1 polysaccharide deacetylase family protein [Halobacterium litoreum]